jgi:NitT/TauT family transport system substrate-binding protein
MTQETPLRPRFSRLLAVATATAIAGASVAAQAADLATIRIAVGGAACLCYLPTVLAEQIGAYKKAGLAIEIANLKGGSQALTAVLGGSADVVSGYFDHTVVIQAKQKVLTAFVAYDRLPGLVLAISPKASGIASLKDLVGKKVGVSAPGSSTDFFLKYLLRKNGDDPGSVAVIGVGLDATAVASMEQGMVDAAVMLDPAVTVLETKYPGLKLLSDTRTEADTLRVFGGQYPGGVLYAPPDWIAKHEKETQALADALVETLQFLHAHSPEEIAAKMPDEFVGPDKKLYVAALKSAMAMYSPTGLMDAKGAQAVLDLFSQSDPDIAKANVDIAKTYTNRFAAAAGAKLGIKD